ncbi:hypothetical protein RGU70_16050 [Herbaspirillum sp. RTI4]|uniref:hypothetical protein n=1 Tax=Herbaspirillum sp. RTI4 TaxID=3048640 RepID=UPI002AB5AB73|nr:hypothetical protein [Herbaspirillum sp. RTI4]MDY7579828.1 hypothetical protein [Herbaspirillum sp. RTI4]MEA9981915.1 hypothetical protein [Herbaspirillum sp. RTI4]
MKKTALSGLLATGLAVVMTLASANVFAQHWHGGGPRFYGGVTIGGPYWGPGPYSPYYYPPQPIIIERPVYQAPEVYVEKAQPAPDYWYFCKESNGYYPYVQSCARGWMKVVPSTTPGNDGAPPR